MSQTLQAVRGMNDVLPEEAAFWELFEDTVRTWLKGYGYKPIRMPIVEPTPLFKRAIGEVTDIVEKEMYSFIDGLNGEALTLRPEGTAGCVRAVIEHNLAARQTQRLYYIGQMFRHERPQKGRYRQFHQVGVETFGIAGPDIDAELILMGARQVILHLAQLPIGLHHRLDFGVLARIGAELRLVGNHFGIAEQCGELLEAILQGRQLVQ